MYVEQVRSIFDGLVDEPDFDFMSVTQRRTALAAAYSMFRMTLAEVDENAYLQSRDLVVAATSIDLATTTPKLLGSAAVAGERMVRLRKISTLENGEATYYLKASRDLTDFDGGSYYNEFRLAPSFLLQSTTLMFSSKVESTIRIWYESDSTVNWSKDVASDNEFIDDFGEYHTLIALYAARDYYMVRDATISKSILSRISIEESRIKNHLGRGRSIDSFESVMEVF